MNNDFFEYIDINLDDTEPFTASPAPAVSHTSTRMDVENISAEDEDEPEKEPPKPSLKIRIIRELISYAFIIIAAFFLAYLTNHFLIVNAQVPTGSMIPTINEGNRIVGNRLAYKFSEPARGDVVIFLYPDDESQNYVKRIIGLPGETVEIIDGIVYINGDVLDESSYLTVTPYGSYGPFTVPEGCYFMMGDNRNSSWDSRFWETTYVSYDKILAKALFCYWPNIHMIK